MENSAGLPLPPRRLKKQRASNHANKDVALCDNQSGYGNHRTAVRFLIIGGGIAGISCAQELARLNPDDIIILISASDTIKEVKSVMKISVYLEELNVYEKTAESFRLTNPRIQLIKNEVIDINTEKKIVILADYSTIAYSRLCICSGARPKVLFQHPNFITIHDTHVGS